MKHFALLLLFVTLAARAQDSSADKKHPIEARMDKAIEENSSTAGMVEAFGKAHEEWDTELNKNYKILMKRLEPEAQKALREAQRSWVLHRDKEIDYLLQFYRKMKGTMYRVIYAETTMSMVQRRALALSYMVEMLEVREGEE